MEYIVEVGTTESIQPRVLMPLVRCKDCKFWKNADGIDTSKRVKFCNYYIGHHYAKHDGDFCSRGERKGGEQDETNKC